MKDSIPRLPLTFQSRKPHIRNKSLAIVHGTADGEYNDNDNDSFTLEDIFSRSPSEDVPFKHSAALAKTFLNAGANFHFKVIPSPISSHEQRGKYAFSS